MSVSIIGDSGSAFLPLYTKFRYSKVSAPFLAVLLGWSLLNTLCVHL
jgi:hypothetical protein